MAFTLSLLALAANPFRSVAQMPIITNQPASRVVWAGANVTVAVGLSNPPPLSPYAASPFVYRWFFTPAGQATPVEASARATNLCAGAAFMGIPLPTVAPSEGAIQGFYISFPNGLAVRPDGTLLVADAVDNYAFQSPSPITPLSTFSALAGTGPPFGFGFPQFAINDGGPGGYANVSRPLSLAADAAGNTLIVDNGHSRIRKVDTNGIITTVAGGGVGDAGPATNAILYVPMGLAADHAGNLFVADHENDRVRKIGTNGIITTVVGTGWWSSAGAGDIEYEYHHPEGAAVDTSGNTFVALTDDRMVIKVTTNGAVTTIVNKNSANGSSGDGDPASQAYLAVPSGVAVDEAGNLYIADAGEERIRRADTNGIITTVAGGGTNGMFIITVIGLGPNGFLTYTNPLNGVGDGGMATNANISVGSVALDAAGNLIFPDYEHHSIRKVDTNGIITTIAGGGTNEVVDGALSTNVALSAGNVAVDAAGNIFAYLEDAMIRKIDTQGVITTAAGNGTSGYSGDGGAATNASLAGGVCGGGQRGQPFHIGFRQLSHPQSGHQRHHQYHRGNYAPGDPRHESPVLGAESAVHLDGRDHADDIAMGSEPRWKRGARFCQPAGLNERGALRHQSRAVRLAGAFHQRGRAGWGLAVHGCSGGCSRPILPFCLPLILPFPGGKKRAR